MSLPQASSNPLPQRKPKRAVKGQENPPSDGIYSNKLMVHSVMLLTGYQVDVELIDSSVWTGVLRTVSPEMAIVLSVAHLKKENTKNKQCLLASHDAIRPHLVIPFGEVVTISASQVDTPYLDSFKTDVEIGALNGTSDRSLKPFTDFGDEDGIDKFSAMNESGGWSVEDMLSTNKNMFNIKSTYTDDLQGYTTQLESSNTPEYLSRQKRAERLAQEIVDRDRHYQEGEDSNVTEEDKYSSVVRPDQPLSSSGAVTPTPQSSSPTSQRQQDSGFAEQLCDAHTEPLTMTDNQQQQIPTTSSTDKIQEQENSDCSHDDLLKDLRDFSTNFQLAPSNEDTQIEDSLQTSGGDTTAGGEENLKAFKLNPEAEEFKLNPEAEEFNPSAVTKLPPSPTTSYANTNSSGKRNSRGGGTGGRGYNHYYQQQQQPAILATIPAADYMAMQPSAAAYMASSYPANQMMPMYQTIPQQQQQQQVTSPRQHQRFLQSSQIVPGGTYFDGMSPLLVQQQAAMMSQLPSNRQTMVAATAPTQPVYIIPQHQGSTTMPHAPTVAFQPAAGQYATLTSPQLPTQYMPYQM